MKTDAVRGHLDGMLLAVLEAGPLHGYAVITAIKHRSADILQLPTGTIYPALNRLEREGLLRSTWSEDEGRRRRCYELTDAGQRRLGTERTEWRSFIQTISSVLSPATPA